MFRSIIISISTLSSTTRHRSIVTNRRKKSNLHTITSISLPRRVSTCLVTKMPSQHLSRRAIRLNFKRLMYTRLFSQILHNSRSRQLQRIIHSTIRNSFLFLRSLRRYKLNLQQNSISLINRRSKHRRQTLTRLRLTILLIMRNSTSRIKQRRIKHRLSTLRQHTSQTHSTSYRLDLTNT